MSDKGKNLIKKNKGKKLYLETAPRGIRPVDISYRQQRFQQKQFIAQQKRLERIMQARAENPVSTECPHCGGVREIYRFTGVVRCPFCDSVEVLPEVHKFVPEIDSPQKKQMQMLKQMTNEVPQQNTDPAKLDIVSDLMGFISLFLVDETCGLSIIGLILGAISNLMGFISLFLIDETCGLAIIGLILGAISKPKRKKEHIRRDVLLCSWIGIALNLIAIFLYSLLA